MFQEVMTELATSLGEDPEVLAIYVKGMALIIGGAFLIQRIGIGLGWLSYASDEDLKRVGGFLGILRKPPKNRKER